MISLNKVSAGYNKNKIINDFSYTFNDTGFYAIKGQSGCGKTTLLNVITGFHKIDDGKILYSEDICDIRKSSALIFQDNNLLEKLTVIDNIKMLTSLSGNIIDDVLIDAKLSELGILKYKNVRVSDISGGERQRVSIVIAILLQKKVIIADEPLSSLDDENSRKIMDIFKEMSKDRLVIITSHNLYLIEKYCDYILDINSSNNVDICQEKLCECKYSENKLGFKKFLSIYSKVVKDRKSLKLLLVILFTLLLTCFAFSISINSYDKTTVMIETMDKKKIDYFSIHGISDNEIESSIKKKKLMKTFFHGIAGYEYDETYEYRTVEPMKYTILDETLNEDEIIITDYIAYTLKHSNVLDFDKINEVKGMYIPFNTSEFDVNGKKVIRNIKIVGIMYTDFSKFYLTHEPVPWWIGNEINECFNFVFINEKTLFNISYRRANDCFYLYNEDKIIEISLNENLKSNEVIVNTHFYEDLLHEKTNTGEIFNLDLHDETSTYSILKDYKLYDIIPTITFNDSNRYYHIEISKETCYEYEYKIFLSTSKEDGYYFDEYDNVKEVEQLIKLANDEEYGIYFVEGYNIKTTFDEIDLLKSVAIVMITVLVVISILIVIYYTIGCYSINQRRFSILEIYGMMRKYKLYLMIFNSLGILILSIILGSACTYLLNSSFDRFLELSYEVTMYIPTFSIVSIVYSSIIISSLLILSLLIGYFISLKCKLKTHIS